MSFQRAHGLTIAQNGFIENLVVESLSSDPTVVEAGRCWFNETQKLFKFSTLDGGGGVIVRAIKDKESYDTFVSSITAKTGDASGASVIGYDGQTGAEGQFSIGAVNVDEALDSIAVAVDAAMQDIDDIVSGEYGSTITSLQTEIDAVETAVGLDSDGTYVQPTGTNYLNSSVSVMDAFSKLDTQSKTNADAITSEASARASADDLKVDLAGDTMGGNLDFAETYKITGLAEPTDPSDAATKGYVDAFSAGLDPKESSRCATTANITLEDLQTIDGVNIAAGDRILVRAQTDPTENGIYLAVDNGAWTRATDFDGTPSNEVSGGSFCFVEEGTAYANMGFVVQATGNVEVGTDPIVWVQFSGAGQIIAGAGIAKTGNELYLKFGAGIMELPGDEIGIDLRASGGLFLTEDGTTDSTDSDAEIGIKLDGTTLSLSASGLRLSDTTNTTLSDMQTEIDNVETGAGLGTGGSYSADGTTHYISGAASLKNADKLLDTQLFTTTGNLSTEVTNRTNADTAIQNEVDAIETNVGLSSAGVWTPPASNYLTGTATVKAALSNLDTAVKSNADDISQEVSDRASAISAEVTARSNADSALQTEINAIETAMGTAINSSGTYVAFTGTNYINGNTNVSADLTDLDTAIKAVADDLSDAIGGEYGSTITSLQEEIDSIETAMGSVIDDNGDYVAFTGKNYINGNTSVAADLIDLDAQAKSLQNEVDAIETAMGSVVGTTGAYSAFSGTNYIDGNTTVSADLTDLDTAIKSVSDALDTAKGGSSSTIASLQTEIDAVESAMGSVISAAGAYVAFSGTNYIDGNADVATDLTDLDAAIKAVADDLADSISGEYGTTMTSLQTEVDAIETAMGNVIDANGDYVAFTGKNYINNNTNVAQDLIDLDTAAKANADAISAEASARSSADSGLSTAISNEASARSSAVSGEASARSSADTAIQNELNATQAGAGLSTAGAYTVDALSNYLKAADFSAASYTASINSAVRLLDAALKGVADDLADAVGGEYGSTISSLQDEIDAVETAMGAMVGTDGSYVAFSGKNYINGNPNVAQDLIDLDAQLKTVTDGLASEITNRGTAVSDAIDALETSIDALVFTFTSSSAATQHT
jgi:phage host-nuclease inhibitor protein Gam